jgi:hypothetical protein
MTYRDELEAALQRAQHSEQALAEERARTAQKDQQIQWLQQQLGQAQSQLAVYQPQQSPFVSAAVAPSRGVQIAQRVLWGFVLLTVIAVGLAASQRETDGVAMARLAAPIWGAAIAGQLASRGTVARYALSLGLGLFAGGALMAFFFVAIWPAL